MNLDRAIRVGPTRFDEVSFRVSSRGFSVFSGLKNFIGWVSQKRVSCALRIWIRLSRMEMEQMG
ncbi:Hypothetical predicted protein [Prunus dulcis]|uniref:Uncharacterized protein n=1 Tax=Prunus dulcis TaxID=3755 RepID=A0A5E4G3W1_PRUDU|nr:Hypothetical predicted protein [Prunus dulcis]